jgi:hypothetical protein
VTQQPTVHLTEHEALQRWVYDLEAYKRRVGRYFDKETTHYMRVWYFNRYNECENKIQELCDKYHLARNTQPYKLKLEQI